MNQPFWSNWSEDQLRKYVEDPFGYWCGLTQEQLLQYPRLPEIYFISIAKNKKTKRKIKNKKFIIDKTTNITIQPDYINISTHWWLNKHDNICVSDDNMSLILDDDTNTNISSKSDDESFSKKLVENCIIEFYTNEVIDREMFNSILNNM